MTTFALKVDIIHIPKTTKGHFEYNTFHINMVQFKVKIRAFKANTPYRFLNVILFGALIKC